MTICAVCQKDFTPARMGQKVCGYRCSAKIGPLARKVERAATRVAWDRLKTRSAWAKEAQTAFNAYIRGRDSALPCISCGRHHTGQIHAGHYLSTGARPELRFNEDNCHAQCQPCNTHLHGNLVLYRVELIRRIGLEAVERLEGPHPAAKLTTADLRAIRDKYRSKLKEDQA